MTADEVLVRLRELAAPAAIESMGRFAIPTHKALGVPTPALRRLAGEIGKNHTLAQALWRTDVFEARLLAPMIDEPSRVTNAQMERWVRAFDSWALCDDCCFELFDKTSFAWQRAMEWSARTGEFEKRAGFSLMAALARHHRNAADAQFSPFLAAIHRQSGDERNFVKKAVNWALREIGKRNLRLNRAAVRAAIKIKALGTSSGRWIASDALRELTSNAVQERLRAKRRKSKPRGKSAR
jgi:3-methyladenine DNA glycosylase AlkD